MHPDTAVFDYLVSKSTPANVDLLAARAINSETMTALHWAIRNGAKVDVELALKAIAKKGDMECLRTLLARQDLTFSPTAYHLVSLLSSFALLQFSMFYDISDCRQWVVLSHNSSHYSWSTIFQ